MKEIEKFLRENKPLVKEDPGFTLEARRRMEQVEGIKAEVDRQRGRGRRALVVALVAGLALGVAASALAYLYPVNAASVDEGLWQSFRLFLQEYRGLLIYPLAALAITLSLVLSKKTAVQ